VDEDRLNVVITGASSGIGRASAVALADKGHRIFAAARSEDRLQALREEAGPEIIPLQVDVTDQATVAELEASVARATDGLGPDVLVNAAGFAMPGPLARGARRVRPRPR
jgi:NADP-dependent 3-hydroxy acid dehydrogenase YdfG